MYLRAYAGAITSIALLVIPLACSAQGTGSSQGGYCPAVSQNLHRGMRDADTSPRGQVSELQKFFVDYYGLDPATYVTGYFGIRTQQNVVRFQREQGLTSFGYVGPLTRAAIARWCATGQPYSRPFSSPTSAPSQSATCPGPIPSTPCSGTWVQSHLGVHSASGMCEVVWICLPSSSSNSSAGSASSGTGTIQPNSAPMSAPVGISNLLPATTGSPNPICEHAAPPAGCSWQSGATCPDDRLVCQQNSCTTPWGTTIPSGSTTTAYQAATVPYGQSCAAQTRACTNGALSGTYTYPSCTPSQYPVLPNPAQTTIISGYDIYSADPVDFNGALRMYFGGWETQSDLPHDSIFVADCTSPTGPCSNIRKVIDPVATGWNQVNDPSIVLHPAIGTSTPAYYIMYMTCNTTAPNPLTNNGICYSTSWATDGINWSPPEMLMTNNWLPSATIRSGDIQLFGNDNNLGGKVVFYDLGTSGVAVGAPTTIVFDNAASIPPYYSNVDVIWRPTLNAYQIAAERELAVSATTSSVIDFLSSNDGINWHLLYPSIISAQAGQYRVGTPAQNPDTSSYIYFGSTARTDSEGFNINAAQWSPPTQ